VKSIHRSPALPIGRTARLSFEINDTRAACCQAASELLNHSPVDEAELEECARLEEALAKAQRLLRDTVRRIMLDRLGRRSRRRTRQR
jgi:hypothetical protein